MVSAHLKSNLRMLNSLNLLFDIQSQVKEENIPEEKNEKFIQEFENKFLNQLKILCYKLFQNNKMKYLTITQKIDKTISENAMLPTGESLFKPLVEKAMSKLEKNVAEFKLMTEKSPQQNVPHSMSANTKIRRLDANQLDRKKSPHITNFSRRQMNSKPLEKPVKTINMRKGLNNSFHVNQNSRKFSGNVCDILATKNHSFVSHIPTTNDGNHGSASKIHRKVSMGLDEYRLRTSSYNKAVANEQRLPKESTTTIMTIRGSSYSQYRVGNNSGNPVKIVGDGSSSKSGKKAQVNRRINTTSGNMIEDSPTHSIMTNQTIVPQPQKYTLNNHNAQRIYKTLSPANSSKTAQSPQNLNKEFKREIESKENNFKSVPKNTLRQVQNRDWREVGREKKTVEPLKRVRNSNERVKEEELHGKDLGFSITGADNENPELRMISVTDCDTPLRTSINSSDGEFKTPAVDV